MIGSRMDVQAQTTLPEPVPTDLGTSANQTGPAQPSLEGDHAELRALAAAVAQSDADPRRVPHDEVRAWLLRIVAGDFNAPPPTPR